MCVVGTDTVSTSLEVICHCYTSPKLTHHAFIFSFVVSNGESRRCSDDGNKCCYYCCCFCNQKPWAGVNFENDMRHVWAYGRDVAILLDGSGNIAICTGPTLRRRRPLRNQPGMRLWLWLWPGTATVITKDKSKKRRNR